MEFENTHTVTLMKREREGTREGGERERESKGVH